MNDSFLVNCPWNSVKRWQGQFPSCPVQVSKSALPLYPKYWHILSIIGTCSNFRSYHALHKSLNKNLQKKEKHIYTIQKLDRLGPIDKRPSTLKLHRFVKKKGGGSLHANTHLVSDRGDTCSTSATWLYRQQDLEEKDPSVNEFITRLFVEQPQLHQVWLIHCT